jgi:ketosteroid isomerase-like protein
MTEHPNATLIRRGYAAFSAGDVVTLTELIAPDAVQHMPGNNRFSGDHRGVQDILAMYGQFAEETQGTFKVDLEELYANDDTVVTVYHVTGDRGGEHIDTRHALVFTMRDGRAVDLLDIASDPDAVDKFWA